jgi:hypothetical protein
MKSEMRVIIFKRICLPWPTPSTLIQTNKIVMKEKLQVLLAGKIP